MPHISKKQLSKKVSEQLEKHIFDFLIETGSKDRRKIFDEIFTKTERIMFAKRLAMIHLIQKGIPTHTISDVLKISPSTVARFELMTENHLFSNSVKWLSAPRITNKILKLLFEFGALPFEAQNKSLGELIDKY